MFKRAVWSLLLLGSVVVSGILPDAQAQFSVEPVLRIEAGAHQSLVTRVSTDAQGRWILSASEDKTARLWDRAVAGGVAATAGK